MATKRKIDYRAETDLSRLTFILAAIGALVFIVAVFAILNRQGASPGQTSGTTTRSETPDLLPKVIYNLSGPVEDIGESFIVINASVFKMTDDGQVSKVIEKRTAFITSETKITKLTLISQEDTNKKLPQESLIIFSQISRGDNVEVISDQNIADKQQFRATHVRILP